MLNNRAMSGGGSSGSTRLLRNVAGMAIIIGAIAALISLMQGFSNALTHSQDFQWSPARMLALGENPYLAYLNGNPGADIVLSQVPNYAQLAYVLLTPLGLIAFSAAKAVWASVNVALAIACPLLAAKLFRLSPVQGLAITILFLISTPVRNTIGNGQHSLLILGAFIGSLLWGESREAEPGSPDSKKQFILKQIASAMLAGLAYTKYSFAPTLGSAYFRRQGLGYFLLTLAPVIAGALLFAIWTGSNFMASDFWLQPIRVASQGVSPGAADLLSLLRLHISRGGFNDRLVTALCLLLAGGSPFLIQPKAKGLAWWSFCSVASLTFVTHLGYDYVFYLLPGIFAVKNFMSLPGLALSVFVSFPWFVSKALISLGISGDVLMPFGLMMNGCTLLLLWHEINSQSARAPRP